MNCIRAVDQHSLDDVKLIEPQDARQKMEGWSCGFFCIPGDQLSITHRKGGAYDVEEFIQEASD